MRILKRQEKTSRNPMENIQPRILEKESLDLHGYRRRHRNNKRQFSKEYKCGMWILDIFSTATLNSVFLLRSTISWAFILVWYAARRLYLYIVLQSTPTLESQRYQARWLLLEANGTPPTLRFDLLWSKPTLPLPLTPVLVPPPKSPFTSFFLVLKIFTVVAIL